MKTMFFRRNMVIGLIILFVGAFVVTSVARGTTIYVDDDNTSGPWDGTLLHPYQHIQEGINNASVGDTVYVFNGTYYGGFEVNKTINLIGENKDSTVLDAGGSYIDISSNTVNFSGFTVQNSSTYGIYVRSDSNTIVNNIVKSGSYAMIYLFFGSYCTVSGNTVMGWSNVGIKERYGSNNTIIGNFVDSCYYGISSELGASNTLISGNTVVNCQDAGVYLDDAYNDTIIDNTFISSGGIAIDGHELADWNTHTIENNYANGKPIYYYKNDSNAVTVPSDAAQVILANCSNFTIQNLYLSEVGRAVQLGFSSYNNINGNTIANNTEYGILLIHSSNNNITGNIITNNLWSGLRVGLSSPDTCNHNIIYHNNFINNDRNARAYNGETCTNIWDDGYPSGGNYWSDFDEPGEGAYDDNGDGIVDSAYNISGIYNQDRYPLMNPWNGTPPTPPCGNPNGDGVINSGDIVYLLNYLFVGGPPPWPALCIGDVGGDGEVNSADIVYLINYLFIGGPVPHDDCCRLLK